MIGGLELYFAITTRTIFRVIIKSKYNNAIIHPFLFSLSQNK